MLEEDINLIAQLVMAQEEAVKKMEELYDKKDIENFKKMKQELSSFQKQLSGLIAKWSYQT